MTADGRIHTTQLRRIVFKEYNAITTGKDRGHRGRARRRYTSASTTRAYYNTDEEHHLVAMEIHPPDSSRSLTSAKYVHVFLHTSRTVPAVCPTEICIGLLTVRVSNVSQQVWMPFCQTFGTRNVVPAVQTILGYWVMGQMGQQTVYSS